MKKRLLFALSVLSLALPALAATGKAPAVPVSIDAAKGVDARVDYSKLTLIGPWDDRNYKLTLKDLALLAPNESEQRDPIPAFFRVEMRRANPGLRRTGEGQYPRSALQIFYLLHKGYQIDGKYYERATIRDGAFVVLPNRPGFEEEDDPLRALSGNTRVTSPVGAAESAIKIHPLDGNKVIAGSNGPGSGQIMHFSTNGGSTWTQAAALPLGSTCCDPTIDYSADGTKAYTSTLGGCGASACNVWVYRSADGGATWTDLQTVTPGDPRREVTSGGISDKEFIHVDKFGTSPRKDNVYLTWHDNNILKFSRSTDFGNTWSAPLTMSSGAAQEGIGSDIATDKSGNVYYFWPTVTGKTTLVRKSTDGGATFAAAVTVATNQDGYDFNIPAMETRRAFQYVSADVDLTNGAFANRIYVAWTDTTAAESATAANNHGRIRVAYSSDGGATWTVRTPHETADANTVDRFHQWLGVGSDGTVHVMFYDTRQNAARTSVDIYYSKSTDGGNTWTTPTRATTATSPHIEDSFQWGDYNGLDVLGSQVLGIFTDNRNESAGSADSIDVYATSAPGVVSPVCGNNLRETPEVCDGSDLAGQTCVSQGFTGGTLSCNGTCTAFVTSACTTTCTPPAVPTGVSATTISTSQINVAWTASAGATSYNVLRSTTSGGPYSSVGTPAASPFSNTGLACNTTYYYVVQASNGICSSANSAQVSATTSTCPVGGNAVVTASATPALAIPDNNTTGVTSTINVATSQTITSVSVTVGITHTYQGDLEVALIGPDNTTVLLHNRTGAGTDNINTTYSITTAAAQALTAFNGKNTSGAWKLRVRDLASTDTGTLNSWKITFNGNYKATVGSAIPDNNTTGVTSTINVPATGTVTGVSVRVAITHTYQGDLEVALIGPDNTTVLLHNRTGAGTDNINTVYADLTAPAQALSAFTGKATNGAWKLRVRDLAAADTGTFTSWELDLR